MRSTKCCLCGGGDAEVVEEGVHADAEGFVVAVDLVPVGGLTSHSGAAYPGQDRAEDGVAEGEEGGEGGPGTGLVEVDPAGPGDADPGRRGQVVEGVVGNEPDVDAVQRGGESFGHAGQAGEDGGELVQGPAAAELSGVVRDGLEAQHAFALPDTRPPGKGGS